MIVDIITICLITIIFIIVIFEKICKKYKDSLNKLLYNLQAQIDKLFLQTKMNKKDIEEIKRASHKD